MGGQSTGYERHHARRTITAVDGAEADEHGFAALVGDSVPVTVESEDVMVSPAAQVEEVLSLGARAEVLAVPVESRRNESYGQKNAAFDYTRVLLRCSL